MTRRLLAAGAALAAVLALAGCGHHHPRPHPSPSAVPAPTRTPSAPPSTSPTAVPTSPGSCHISDDYRPDAACTPGALNPDVTQATTHTTICVAGWTATVRPPASYTEALKVQQIRAYGYTDTDPAMYEEDHEIPLDLGGAPRDPHNLWPEPRNGLAGRVATDKDADETAAVKAVCSGAVSLDAERAQFLAKWGPA